MKLIDPIRLVSNFIKEAGKYIANGRPKVTPHQYKERLDICDGCDKMRKSTFTCGSCGCYLGTKAEWRTTTCPEHKWPEIEEIHKR